MLMTNGIGAIVGELAGRTVSYFTATIKSSVA
jgi:hypothetical protein